MSEKYIFILDLLNRASIILSNSQIELVTVKEGNIRNVLTDLDIKINDFLKAEILKKYPEEKIFSEEDEGSSEGNTINGTFWSLDPIDGSSNFASGIPHFAIVVSFIENGEVQMGGAHNPVTDQVFSFEKGKGAYFNGKKIENKNTKNLERATLNFNAGRSTENRAWMDSVYLKISNKVKSLKAFGSSALDFCFVGTGAFDVNVYAQLSPFDIAFAIEFVRQAGGVVVDADFKELEINFDKQRVMAFGSRELMEEFKKVIS